MNKSPSSMGIRTLRLGICNTYLIPGREGLILVDCGLRGWEKGLFNFLTGSNLEPNRIRLIVATHTHYDHVGALAAIKGVTCAWVLVHRAEQETLAQGKMIFPPATNLLTRALSGLINLLPPGRFDFPPVQADIIVDDHFSLKEFGLDGRVIHTPGHTNGSISLILETGQAFIGDAAVNYLPVGIGSIMPPFAEDIDQVMTSWARLLDSEARIFYPAHGRPISKDRLQRALNRRRSKKS